MPVAIDPDATFRTWLRSDADKDPRPEFEFRYLTNRQWGEIARIQDGLEEYEDGIKAMDAIFDLLKKYLVALHNMGDYTADRLEDLLTNHEAQELVVKISRNSEPTEDDLGKSDLPQDSDTEESAADAKTAA